MIELPTDFPHQPPKGYSYETKEFKPNIIGIWIRNHARFSYSDDIKCIWGFYNTKKRCYIAPITHKRPGKIVTLDKTSAYSAMPLLKLALDTTDDASVPAMIDSSTKDTTVTTTFADFQAQQDARNTNQLNVRKYTLMLCDALVDNFKSRNKGTVGRHQAPVYKFYIDEGRKYYKIIMETDGGSRSIHAFVDKKTGDVYKAASFKAPAKGVRFNLLIITDREWLLENADWAGGYLYRRG